MVSHTKGMAGGLYRCDIIKLLMSLWLFFKAPILIQAVSIALWIGHFDSSIVFTQPALKIKKIFKSHFLYHKIDALNRQAWTLWSLLSALSLAANKQKYSRQTGRTLTDKSSQSSGGCIRSKPLSSIGCSSLTPNCVAADFLLFFHNHATETKLSQKYSAEQQKCLFRQAGTHGGPLCN